jgi:hypothetical protein
MGQHEWAQVSTYFAQKSPIQCRIRNMRLQAKTGESLVGTWTSNEDDNLRLLIKEFGARDWSKIANYMQQRNGKQCRQRWTHHLQPSVKKQPWNQEEDSRIIQLQAQYGNCWSKIAKHIPGRTDNQVKNRFNANLKKRLAEKKIIVQDN